MKIKQLNKWIKNQKKINKMDVFNINFNSIKGWNIDTSKIYNDKKKFFSIEPYKFNDQQGKTWCQPLIVQKEVGILGIIKKKIKSLDYYLLQAKIEPGNIDNIQLSPTVQATKSNYLRAHGGKKTKYINYFIKRKRNFNLVTSLRLSEQGTRYFEKSNKNILIESKKNKLKNYKSFIWVSKQNLIYLIKKKNLLNMDSISVFSSSIKKNEFDNPLNRFDKIKKIFIELEKKFSIIKKKISFQDLKGWRVAKGKIYDIGKNFFSIIALKIKSNSREVNSWSQPIISDHFRSFNGFLLKMFNDTNHYLLQLVLEPGFKKPKFTSTISIKNFSHKKHNVRYLNYFKVKKNILLDVINSDEGGRFFKNETRNMISILNNKKNFNLPKKYIWASHNQVVELISKNLLSIEARNLFASFNIDKIK